MPIASAWYSPSSGSFWADIIAIAGIVAAILIARQTFPRRRLTWTTVSRSRLMIAPEVMRDAIKVSYKDNELANPYLVALEISSTGRSTIPSTSFDKGRSLKVNVNAEILAILSLDWQPTSAEKPSFTISGTVLELAAELVAKREVIKLALLTEGPVKNVKVKSDPFADVKIAVKDRETSETRRRKFAAIALPVMALVALALTVTATVLSVNHVNAANDRADAVAGESMCINTLEFAQSTQLAFRLTFGDIILLRADDNKPSTIKFSSKYYSDLSIFDTQARFLLATYKGIDPAEARHIAASANRAIAIFGRLPKEHSIAAETLSLDALKAAKARLENPHLGFVPQSLCNS